MNLKEIIKSDLFRYTGKINLKNFIKSFLFVEGFHYSVILRITNHLSKKKSLLFYIFFLWWKHDCRKYGIQIAYTTKIGYGFYIGHFGGIVINPHAIIGNNVNISQGVTIGTNIPNKFATIGDRVYIGPGVKIVGAVRIGSCSEIGANAVVTKDVPEKVCVAGVPAKIIKNLSEEPRYIHRIYVLEKIK